MTLSLEQQVCSLELSRRLKDLGHAPVLGYAGLYIVTVKGEVYSVVGGRWRFKARSLKKGYAAVTLSKKGLLKTHLVHRLVAMAFIPNPKGFKQVNHIDGFKTNNSVENLEWCDASHNQNHARRLGLQGGEHSNTAKLTRASVRAIRKMYGEGGPTMKQIGKKYGVNEQTISKIINYKTWKYA